MPNTYYDYYVFIEDLKEPPGRPGRPSSGAPLSNPKTAIAMPAPAAKPQATVDKKMQRGSSGRGAQTHRPQTPTQSVRRPRPGQDPAPARLQGSGQAVNNCAGPCACPGLQTPGQPVARAHRSDPGQGRAHPHPGCAFWSALWWPRCADCMGPGVRKRAARVQGAAAGLGGGLGGPGGALRPAACSAAWPCRC